MICGTDGSIQNKSSCLFRVANLTAEKNSLDIKYKKSEEEKLMAFTDLRSKLNESEKRLKESENRYNSLQRKYEETSHNCNTEVFTK